RNMKCLIFRRKTEAEGDSPKSRERLAIREPETEIRSLCRTTPPFKGGRGDVKARTETQPSSAKLNTKYEYILKSLNYNSANSAP
ncbi:MAG: hypothetical protein EA393_11975, partial [Bacteroidetes bacterium]